jgi:hypothetical protein
MAVDCPPTGTIGSSISCVITAQVESSEAEKEVDFSCYILNGTTQYSLLNFNQMINTSLLTMTKSFAIPGNFNSKQYTLECSALYYNLGSRTDTFSDTFQAVNAAGGGGGVTNNNNGDTWYDKLLPSEGGTGGRAESIQNISYLGLAFALIAGICIYIYFDKKTR